ncbi:MAG: hypothetical protein K8S62_04145 [Candidatus Sabulitectum sp.]|nr:hypothetical protein [Candidatus Sabulitectum sp.]
MKTFAFYSAIITILVAQASGFGFYDSTNKGTIIPGLSPSTTALGSVRALGVAEAVSLFYNPAQTAFLPADIQVSGSSIQWTERVIQTDIEKTVRTIMTNDNGTAAVIYPAGPIVIGAGIAKIGEFDYEGVHTVYDDPDDPELGVAVLWADGSQWEALAGVSSVISGQLSAGFSAGVRMVNADYHYEFNSHQTLIPDSSAYWSIEDKAFAWHAGLALGGEMFKSGISYSSETDYMDDIIAFGASAFAPHLKSTTVGFEAQITSPLDHNRFMGNLFFQMPLTENMNALTSVSFDDHRVANRAGLGFGLGFDLRLNRFVIGGGLLSRFKARKNTAFPGEQSDRVDDSSTMFTLGISCLLGS